MISPFREMQTLTTSHVRSQMFMIRQAYNSVQPATLCNPKDADFPLCFRWLRCRSCLSLDRPSALRGKVQIHTGTKCEVIETQWALHARETIEKLSADDLQQQDGIIAVRFAPWHS